MNALNDEQNSSSNGALCVRMSQMQRKMYEQNLKSQHESSPSIIISCLSDELIPFLRDRKRVCVRAAHIDFCCCSQAKCFFPAYIFVCMFAFVHLRWACVGAWVSLDIRWWWLEIVQKPKIHYSGLNISNCCRFVCSLSLPQCFCTLFLWPLKNHFHVHLPPIQCTTYHLACVISCQSSRPNDFVLLRVWFVCVLSHWFATAIANRRYFGAPSKRDTQKRKKHSSLHQLTPEN